MSVDQRSDRDWLMGGGGAPDAFKRFRRDTPLPIGHSVTGIIESWKREPVRDFKTGEPRYWDKAQTEPMEQLVITIQTELCEDRYRKESGEPDDGKRRLFIAKQSQKKALKEAILGAGLDFIERGARITMTLTGYTEYDDGGYPSPDFSAVLVPAAQIELMGDQTAQAQPAATLPPSGPTITTYVDEATQQAQAQQLIAQQLGGTALSAPVQPAQPAPVSSPAPAAPVAQAPAQAPAQPVATAVAAPAGGVAAPAGSPATGVDPAMLQAALAALTPEQRAAMGIG